MKRNILPFAIIAIVGVFVAVVVYYVGVSQREDIRLAENGEAVAEGGEVTSDAEGIFASSCASCHGADLSGGVGPDLTTIGSTLSQAEIEDVINNGIGTMPPGLVNPEEATILAEWLSEKQ